MQELLHLIEDPRPCSYLPQERAALEYRIVHGLDAESYERHLAAGYRRFGRQLFRPGCPVCQKCVSIRVLVDRFRPSASLQRVKRKNRHIRAVRREASVTPQHVKIYNRYQQFMATQRGWPSDAISCEQYYESFVSGGGDFAQQWMYFDSDRLVGVALMDETPQSISLVYFFHEPCWRPLSPGLFSVLTQLDYAREQGKRHAYPGYWISENTSMAYKARFRPFERLVSISSPGMEPIWLEDGLRSILSA